MARHIVIAITLLLACGCAPLQQDGGESARQAKRLGAPTVEKELECGKDVVVKQEFPDYPASAFRAGREGWIQLEFVLEGDGRASKIQVIKSNPPGVFEKSAIAALERSEFKADAKRTCRTVFTYGIGIH